MQYVVVVLLSLLAVGSAICENRVIKVENVHEVCAVMSRISQHYERSLPGSECVYTVNGSNACKNCLDLNCSIVVESLVTITLASEVSVLPCHDGNLNVPSHAIDSRISDATGQQLFERSSTRSFNGSFKLSVFGLVTLMPFISANIDNRGDGVFFQVNVSVPNVGSYEVFPPTFIPITCSEVDRSVCFGNISGETSTPAAKCAGVPASVTAVWTVLLLAMFSCLAS